MRSGDAPRGEGAHADDSFSRVRAMWRHRTGAVMLMRQALAYMAFVVSILWIYIIADELVAAIQVRRKPARPPMLVARIHRAWIGGDAPSLFRTFRHHPTAGVGRHLWHRRGHSGPDGSGLGQQHRRCVPMTGAVRGHGSRLIDTAARTARCLPPRPSPATSAAAAHATFRLCGQPHRRPHGLCQHGCERQLWRPHAEYVGGERETGLCTVLAAHAAFTTGC